MQHLINQGTLIANDEWQLFDEASVNGSHTLYPLAMWVQQGAELSGGVWIDEAESIDELLAHLPRINIIVFNFNKFADGRAFSLAKLLREKHHFSGDIRASGDILPDQANYLQRVGFSSMAYPSQERAETALAVIGQLAAQYQESIDQPLPRFRRR